MYDSRAIFFFDKIQKFSLLINFGCAGSLLLHRFSLVVVGGGYSLVTVHRLLTVVVTLVVAHRLNSCSTWA